MDKFNSDCPNCGGRMLVRNLSCGNCGLKLEGEIELPTLARLGPEDREFIELFVLYGGSLKNVGSSLGISYPTVRIRLDKVIENLKTIKEKNSPRRLEILEKLEKGEINATDAVELLKKLNL